MSSFLHINDDQIDIILSGLDKLLLSKEAFLNDLIEAYEGCIESKNLKRLIIEEIQKTEDYIKEIEKLRDSIAEEGV